MSFEWMSSHVDEWPSLKDSPEYQKQLNERVKKIEQDEKNYKHLVKVNDVLNVLDFPDDKEEAFRKVLEKQDNETLKELATKSKKEILIFVTRKNIEETSEVKKEEIQKQNVERETQTIEIKKNDLKYQKIKDILPQWIYNWNPKFNELVSNLEKFESLQTWENTDKNIDINKIKAETLGTIFTQLKDWELLKSVVNELGWANLNNPQYLEFKNTLIDLDPSFKDIFPTLEKLEVWENLNTSEVIKWIEKDSWGILDIDLKNNVSKLHLPESNYSFDKELDKQALLELEETNNIKERELERGITSLKGLYKPFTQLLNEVGQDFWEEQFRNVTPTILNRFSWELFQDMKELYENIDIDSNIQITQQDMLSLANSKTPQEFKLKLHSIWEKFQKLAQVLEAHKKAIKQEHETAFKEIVSRDSESKEKELDVLKFLNISAFDQLPKSISDMLIKELKGNVLSIPWLNLNVQNIDLANWNFWESFFQNDEKWINIWAKRNIVMFMNKLISWDINEPLSVEAIANWTMVANPNLIRSKFIESKLVSNLWWNYNQMRENLKKQQKI